MTIAGVVGEVKYHVEKEKHEKCLVVTAGQRLPFGKVEPSMLLGGLEDQLNGTAIAHL